MEQELLQVGGAVALIALIIRELFSYLKTRKDSSNIDTQNVRVNDNSDLILGELQKMNSNHLHTIQEVLEQGNARLIDSMHNDNVKIIELLAEIKGNLSNRR